MYNGEFYTYINDIKHWYKIAGIENNTTPIIVIHGGPGGNTYNFEYIVGPLLERFFPVIYYDQRGCGRSDGPSNPKDYSIDILLKDLDIIRQNLFLNKFIPLGFSFGGQLALEYALAYPDHVEKLIVQSPSLGEEYKESEVQIRGFLQVADSKKKKMIMEVLDRGGDPVESLNKIWKTVDENTVDRFLFHKSEAAKLNRKLWRQSGLKNTGEMMAALRSLPPQEPGLLERVKMLRCDTLLIIGQYDRNHGLESCMNLANNIPRAAIKVFHESAHFPDIEETELYIHTIKSFIN